MRLTWQKSVYLLVVCMLAALSFGSSAQNPQPQIRPMNTGIVSDTWAVRLAPGTNPDTIAAQNGFVNLGQVGSLANTYVFQAGGVTAQDAAQDATRTASLRGNPAVLYAEQQVSLARAPRTVEDDIIDPRFFRQWHLNNTGQGGGVPGEDGNVLPAWNAGFTGAGIVVASVDDGVWMTHPDLINNLRPDLSRDTINNDNDPTPDDLVVWGGSHGTPVAGVMAADNDGANCGVGVAFDAQIAALKIFDANEGQTDLSEGGALSYRRDAIHVYNNSWGPFDNGRIVEGPGMLAAQALEEGVTLGRNGLGSIFVWAAGNGGDLDNINADGYANSIYTIAVGASTNFGDYSWYSEPGSPMLVNAPSNGGSRHITTTGWLNGECANDFGGTSSAAPYVSGVVALMLQANPNLTWRDVQHILVLSAEQNDPTHRGWRVNGAGYMVNHNYGFGRVDAAAAVAMAQTWENVAPMVTLESSPLVVGQNFFGRIDSEITLPNDVQIEHVAVTLNIQHERRGQLDIRLIAPNGTVSRLMYGRTGDTFSNYENWTMTSVHHWDETSGGTWRLRIRDTVNDEFTGTLDSWQLTVHGTAYIAPPSNVTVRVANTDTAEIRFVDNATNETGYELERSTDNTNWSQVNTVGENNTLIYDGPLATCTVYYYRVRAVNAELTSQYIHAEPFVSAGCADLITNGSFETSTDGITPDSWTFAFRARDRVRCSPDITPHDQNCAVEFRGGIGENARLVQNITVEAGTLTASNGLQLEGYVSTQGTSVLGRAKATIFYTDGTRGRINLLLGNSGMDYQYFNGRTNLSGDVERIKVRLIHRSEAGRMRFDGVALLVTPVVQTPLGAISNLAPLNN